MTKGFRERLATRQEEIGSLVCVGLDPLKEKIPQSLRKFYGKDEVKAIYHWMTDVVDATTPFASMFKPQRAHYEAIEEGAFLLQKIVGYIKIKYPDIPVFLDCKRGDIARTQKCYQIAHFEIDGVDGMNFNPYMGKDCMKALVDKNHPERAIVGLCYTSNPSAREVQDVMLAGGMRYWEFIAEKTLGWAKECGVVDNAGLVMAAAYEAPPTGSGNIFSWHLERGRRIVGEELWFLIPGIGTQGGFVEQTVKHGYLGAGTVAINSSSEIIFASSGEDFAEASAHKAESLQKDINTTMKSLGCRY